MTMALKLLTVGLVMLIMCTGMVAGVGLRRGPHHPHGQRPVNQKHHHYRPQGHDTLTQDSNLLQDKQHLEEDSKLLTPEMLAKMSPEELEFHYFTAHDFDHNSKLDGLELLKSIYHTIDHDYQEKNATEQQSNAEFYIELVDRTLSEDDTNNDGYVSYPEYRAARNKTTELRSPNILHLPQPSLIH